MNFSDCVRGLLASIFLLLSTCSTQTIDKQSLATLYNELNATLPDKIDNNFAKEVEVIINAVNCIFGDLACLVQEDAIEIEEKNERINLLQEITKTRKVLNKVLKDFINKPTLCQLDQTMYLLSSILKQLEESLKSSFITYKAFDLDSSLKRSVSIDELSEASLKSDFENMKSYCENVQKKAESAGLTWYNHLYRNTADRYIIQPCAKYNLHWKGIYSAAGFAAFTYLWYKFHTSENGCTAEDLGLELGDPRANKFSYNPQDHIIKQIPGRLHDYYNYFVRHYCGWPPSAEESSLLHGEKNRIHDIFNKLTEAFGQNPSLADNQILRDAWSKAKTEHVKPRNSWLARLDEEGHRITYSWWTPFMTALYVPYHEEVHAKYKELRFKAENNIKKWHYWLKGGAFYQRYKFKKDHFRIEPRFTFDDIIGLDHAKHVLGDIVKYIEDPERYERAGLTPAMGYLLFGPTRTGKSMIAEALAGELQRIKGSSDDFPFFVIEARYISSEGNFNMIMNIIKNYAPCIIFIDEIDMLNLHRKFQKNNVLLSEFLATISGCMNNNPDKQVIIIAATNKPDDLDPSLRSRLSVHIPFEYPSFANRAECIIRELEGKGLPLEQFDIRKLAEQTEKCSYQQLHWIVNNAQFLTRETGKPISQLDIERSLNTEVRNVIYHDYKDLSDQEINTLSIHMAGHALAYMLIEGQSEQLSQVTIRPVKSNIEDESQWKEIFSDKERPIIQYGHIFTHLKGDSLKFLSKKDIKRKCMIELAGRIAEELIFDTSFITKDSCSTHDKARAFYWAKKYFLDGIDEGLLEGSKAMHNKIIDQAYTFVEACEQEMRTLLADKKDLLCFIADSLKKIETLGLDEMYALIDIHKMMNGKSVEEFIKELEEQAISSQADMPEEPSAISNQKVAFNNEHTTDEA